jgi:hypothetical protein
MIEKFLVKRCSTEVQLMLTRMKERPEDFDYGSGWRKLVETAEKNSSPYTKIERLMVLMHWERCRVERARRELLSQIMQETINPTKADSPVITKNMQSLMNTHNAHVAQHAAMNQASNYSTGFKDPRSVYEALVGQRLP